jgi:hypothetical protein
VILMVILVAASIAHAKSPEPTVSPISREALSALMKHPTEPHYDLLRPMSGRWIRCRKNGNESTPGSASGSTQDLYSSSDRSHFSHTIARSSDGECKTLLSEVRTSYECAVSSKQTLSCKALKTETKTGSGAWLPVKLSDSDLKGSTLKVSFVGLSSARPNKKAHLKADEGAERRTDGRKLELRIVSDATSESESIQLDFSPVGPAGPRPKKHASSKD